MPSVTYAEIEAYYSLGHKLMERLSDGTESVVGRYAPELAEEIAKERNRRLAVRVIPSLKNGPRLNY